MQKKTILQSLKQDLKILQKQYGINSLFLFRSMARGTHTQTTDIDIPVTFHQPLGFFKFMDLKDLSDGSSLKEKRENKANKRNFDILA